MTRITNTQINQATEKQEIVTACSSGQQDLRHDANEELYAFYAMLFGAAKRTTASAISRLQQKLFTVGVRYPS